KARSPTPPPRAERNTSETDRSSRPAVEQGAPVETRSAAMRASFPSRRNSRYSAKPSRPGAPCRPTAELAFRGFPSAAIHPRDTSELRDQERRRGQWEIARL